MIPFFDFEPSIRRAIYTTNAIESVHSSVRHITDNRAAFPNDEAILKLLYLAFSNASDRWTMPISNWKLAVQQLALHFEGRLPLNPPENLLS